MKISGPASHQGQTCFDIAATDDCGAALACLCERSSRLVS